MPVIVANSAVTLVGGAEFRHKDLTACLKVAPEVVAADGGADALLAAGVLPMAVIGDMDSAGPAAAAAFADRIYKVEEQETTDFDKALRHVTAPLIVALGFTGGRLDHELSVLHSLLARPDRPCIVVGPESLCFLCPPRVSLALSSETALSLFPMGQVEIASAGLKWPTAGIRFAPGHRIGTSNSVTGPVRLEPSAPVMLVILPKQTLPEAVRALVEPETGAALWPARA